ncbi:hypothetical protein [Rhodobacter sp. NSM]|uniref:hypothetical protein n=1 Tax=Rhodobacter sp. NSM TaxID=3457501 RepID=UPI003FD0AB1F
MNVFRLPLIAGLAGLLASAAAAQTTTAQGTTMGRDWDAPMVDTFFNPGGSMTMRTEAEVRSSWDSLSEEQKSQVRDDCASFGTAGVGTDAAGTSGGTSAGTVPAEGSASGGATSPIGQPTGEEAAGSGTLPADDTTGHPDTKVSNVGESDATTQDTGTTAGPGTSEERVTAAEQAMTGSPSDAGTGATTNPAAGGATVGTGEASMNATNTSSTEAASESGSDDTPGTREFDSAAVSLTSWTQICQMVETF